MRVSVSCENERRIFKESHQEKKRVQSFKREEHKLISCVQYTNSEVVSTDDLNLENGKNLLQNILYLVNIYISLLPI